MGVPVELTKARIDLLVNHPFFGSVILRLKVVDASDNQAIWRGNEPTMAVDGESLFYDRSFIEAVDHDELVATLAHEGSHIMGLHHLRMQDRDFEKWNYACDYAVNPIIESCGLKLPKGRLRSADYDGKSAEEIYSLLPNRGKKGGQKQQQSGQGQGQPQPGDGQPQNGQGKGKANKERLGAGCGQVLPYPKTSPADIAEQEQQVKIAVAQAAQYAKACGKFPGALEKVIGKLLEPKVVWKEVLKRFVQAVARNDYTWKRPNPRYMPSGFYLPSLYNERLGRVVWVNDTSGSISDEELKEMASEIDGILSEFNGAHVTVIDCDAAVQHVDEFDGESPVELKRYGGGGTNFKPPFEWLEKEDAEKPTCLIYATDGFCSSFPDVPEFPVLWLSVRNFNPPFGEIVPLREKFQD